MVGAGVFKNRIAENDYHLSNALDNIPNVGEVTYDDYQYFINEFLLAFQGAERKGGVPTASRLLSMKRPDYFICVNKGNIPLISKDIGFSPSRLDFNTYWREIIEAITHSNWWRSRRPSGVEGRIWDNRAAMLDAIYYTPV